MNLKALEKVDYIVVHCSATTPEMNWGRKEIDLSHRQRGFLTIGYHLVIRRDGTLEFGRPLDRQGAHVRGFNHRSVGICMSGGVRREEDGSVTPENNFTDAQFEALKNTLAAVRLIYPTAQVVGHYELDPGKACPSFRLEDYGLK